MSTAPRATDPEPETTTMTQSTRAALVKAYSAAVTRSEHAATFGDRAGSLIAAGDARRILAQLNAARMAAAS
jgi:hypothetical protein